MDQTGVVAIILGVLTLAGTYVTVRYRDYWANKPKKKDRLEVFLERYDKDIEKLSERLDIAERKLHDALRLLDEKESRINILEQRLIDEGRKYNNLLRRFNNLKQKYEESQRKIEKTIHDKLEE